MPRLIRPGLWCLSLALIMGTGVRAADTPADNPPAAKAAAPEKGEAKPESSAARSPSERAPVRMPPEGAPRSMRGFGGGPPAPPTDVLSARFEATVYEVQVPVDRAGKLDPAALSAKAASADDLCKALAEFGPTKTLYRVDQPVNVFSEMINVGSRAPFVTNSRLTDTGAKVNTVQYQQVGLIVHLSATPPPKESNRKGPDVQMQIEVAAMRDSAVEISPGAKASIVQVTSVNHSESLQYARPQVMLNVTYPQKGDKDSAYACVIRYVFSEVKP